MAGAVERSGILSQDKDLAEGAGKSAPLTGKENFERLPHPLPEHKGVWCEAEPDDPMLCFHPACAAHGCMCSDPADPQDDCDHQDFDSDWEGRRTCLRCGHIWYATAADFERERQAEIDFQEAMDREERRARWREWWLFGTAWLRPRLRRKPVSLDDEIPF